jgi:hypothetical protein
MCTNKVNFMASIFLVRLRASIFAPILWNFADAPIEFCADSKKELLAEMVKFLKGTGHTGVLRVVN